MRILLILIFSVLLAPTARAQPESPDPAPYIAACEAGDGFSCLYAYGVQQRADSTFWLTDEGVALFVRGCEVGSDRACWVFERINTPNPYGPIRYDRERYLPIALSGCERGSSMACWQAAGFYEDGSVADRERGEALARQSCEAGFSDGCARQADLLASLGRNALEASRAACYGNRVGRMRKLGDCQAVCAEGDGTACYELALMYHRGRDGAQTMRRNAVRARELFAQACGLGETEACER
ncbi:hypothetical protein [Maricaulis sp.]|uniref:hypothetical protein n=1 Tax=Maricaulis sp. TaxID=1486257 RepID=UPI003A8DFD2A